MKNKPTPPFLLFLIAISAVGAGLVYSLSSVAGAGLSADGALYLSNAANLLRGRGLVDLYGRELTLAPPLYPVILALLGMITHMDVFVVGWYLGILVFGLIVIFSGLLFWRIYPRRMLLACIGCIVVATSGPMLNMSASILSDPLFVLFVVLFLWEGVFFIQDGRAHHIMWLGLWACLSSLDRYAGLALTLTGAVCLLYFYRKELIRGLIASAFFLLSALPLMLWGVFHNYPISGRLFGAYGAPSLFGNVYSSLEKILYWFIPFSIIRVATPIGLLAGFVLILLLLNRPKRWVNWFSGLIRGTTFVPFVFFLVYLAMLIVTIPYVETSNLWSERYHVVLLVPLLVILMAVYEGLVPPVSDNASSRIKDGILLVLFAVWLIYPVMGVWKGEQASIADGGVDYNRFNFADIKSSDFIKSAQGLPAGRTIYSNYEAAAWFYLRRDIRSAPRVDPKSGQFDPVSLSKFRASLQSSPGSYLVWFKTIDYRDNLPNLDQLREAIPMEPVFTSDIGDVYRMP